MLNYDKKIAGEKIQRWEAESGLLGKNVACRAGIPQSDYSYIRNGKRRGSIETLSKIVRVFNKKLDDLVGPETQKPPPTETASRMELYELGGIKNLPPHVRDVIESADREVFLEAVELLKLTKSSPRLSPRLANLIRAIRELVSTSGDTSD